MADDLSLDTPLDNPSPPPAAAEPSAMAQDAAEAAATRVRRSVKRPVFGTSEPAPEPAAPVDTGGLLPSEVDPKIKGEAPDLSERFRLSQVDAFYRGSLAGTARLQAMASIMKESDDNRSPEEIKARKHIRDEYRGIVADLARYDLMAPFSTTMEGAASLGGQLVGGLPSPESLIGPGARGATLLGRTARAALTQGVIQAGTDPVVQAGAIHAGVQEQWEPLRSATAPVAGAVIGGGLHLGGELIGSAALKGIRKRMATEDPSFHSADDANVQAETVAPETPPAETRTAAPPAETPEPEPTREPAPPEPVPETAGEPPSAPSAAPTEPVTHRVSTPAGHSVEVRPEVVEASELLTSADAGYDAGLQPRDRERAASQQQIREIAGNLDPERLGFSTEADRGAPIVGDDGMVESGNGRVLAIRQAYERGGESAQRYRDWIASQGIDVSGYNQPVLIRRRVTPMSPDERRAFTVAANQSATLSMSASERALSDARLIDESTLDLIRNPDDLGALANRDFVRSFIGKLPQPEQGAMLNAEGGLSAEGLTRVRNAIIGSAYGDAPVLVRIAEATDDEVKSISNALVSVAPVWAKLRADVRTAHVRADIDQTAALIEAVTRTADLRGRGQKLDTFLTQQDAFERVSPIVEDFMRMFYDPSGRRAAGANRIADALRFYVEEGRKITDGGLDLGLPPVSVAELQRLARERAQGNAATGQKTLFLRNGAGDVESAVAARSQISGRRLGEPRRDLASARAGRDQAGQGRIAGDELAGEDALAARRSGGVLPMERQRPQPGVPSQQQTTGTAVATVPQSQRQQAALRSLQQQASDLADALGFPLREGRIRSRTALGTFNKGSGVVRSREIADLEVVAHEAGHYIERRIGKDLTALTKRFRSELEPLVSNPAAYNPSQYVREGFAEYVRRYIGNAAHAQQVAPGFTAAFQQFMAQRGPQIMQALDRAAAAYKAYLDAPSADAVAAVVRSVAETPRGWRSVANTIRENGMPATIRLGMQWAYTSWFDRDAPIARVMREINTIRRQQTGAPVNLQSADNPEVLQRLFARTEQAAVRDMLDGVRPYREVAAQGPSLSAAIAKATGEPSMFGRWDSDKVAAFAQYLVARRAEYLWRKHEAGRLQNPPAAFSKADASVAMAELERTYPGFRAGSDMVHAYTRELLAKMRDGHLISSDLHDTLAQEEFYVPFYRDMSDRGTPEPAGSGGGRNDVQTADVVKRMRGSTRDIKNPIESLMMQTFLVNRAIRHNDIILALRDRAKEIGIDGGRYFEPIPSHEARKYTFDLKDAIYRKAVQVGMDPNYDAKLLADSVADVFGEDPLMGSFFRMEEAGRRGEPIVFYKEGGELKAGRVMSGSEGHALYETITALPKGLDDLAVQLLSSGSALLRSGIVLNPVYALTNYIRDQLAAAVLRPDYVPFWSGARGVISEFRQGQPAQLYGYAGGVSAGAAVAPLRQAAEANINALARKGYLVQRLSSLHGFLEFTQFTEAGTRNSVFETVYRRRVQQGLSEYEAMIEAAFAAQDSTIDFSRWGSKTLALRAMTPFVNANIQGLDKAYRTMIQPLLRQAVTTQDAEARRNAILSLSKFMAVGGALGAAWAALHHSDEIYHDASPSLIGTHFVTSVGGKIILIPKPFELSLGFTAGEYAYRRLMQDDPRAAEQFAKAAYDVLMPPIPVAANPLIKVSSELLLNRSFFTGRDIVPDRLQGREPELQYTDRTSGFAKAIGQAIGVSPIKVDYAIGGYFGLWGRDIMSLSSGIEPDAPAQAIEDYWLLRRFIKDPTRTSDVTTRFWDDLARTTGSYNKAVASYDALVGRRSLEGDAAAREYLAKLPSDQRVFVTLRSAATDTGRQAFRPEERRLHPLNRAYDAVTVLNGVRGEILDNRFYSFATGENIKLSPQQRGQLRDAVRELAQKEMRNALVIIKSPGYGDRQLIDTDDTLAKIRAISPAAAEEIASRYANKKIFTAVALERIYQPMAQEVIRHGSEADLSRFVGVAEDFGYELGGERVKRPQKRRIPIAPQPTAPATLTLQ